MTSVESIREHYDELSSNYLRFWGEHIHHGYWQAAESPKVAQENLVRELATRAEIAKNARVLDIGCGLGGSSLWLARTLDCDVVGITISPVQAEMARKKAKSEGLNGKVEFRVFDANQLDQFTGIYDAIWIIECSEHIFDKAQFFRNCANLLRPGGCMALCAWTSTEQLEHPEMKELVSAVCDGMLCPNLANISQYTQWLADSGFGKITADDITAQTAHTWDFCSRLLVRPEVKVLLTFSGERVRRFAKAFTAIQQAYARRAMGYAMISAIKIS